VASFFDDSLVAAGNELRKKTSTHHDCEHKDGMAIRFAFNAHN
jgi:hypothetical protein